MHKLLAIAVSFLVLLSALALSACFGIPEDPDVAATVNGDKVYEDEVTEYIEGFRSKNQMYESDSGWMQFLTENSFTAETIREYVLNETFIPKLLIRQECLKRSISLTDEVLEDVIAREKAFYEAKFGENSWESVLASYGYDEATWRENESDRLLEEQLKALISKDAQVSAAEIQAQADETARNYNGKHSYYCTCESEEQARRLRSKLVQMDDDLTVNKFKDMVDNPVNGGWNSLAADRNDLSMEYVNALDELDENEVSPPLQQGDGYILIWCDKIFTVEEDAEYVSLKDIPKAILRQLKADALEKKQNRIFDKWLAKKTKKSSIQVSDMPDDLPYNVNAARSES